MVSGSAGAGLQPGELLDAALIDGFSQMGTVIRVMILLSLLGIKAVESLGFIS